MSFSDKLISQDRIKNGLTRLKQQRELFARVEKDYGVPAPVIAGLWALESDYGAFMGKMSILRSLATLAYDCRRGEKFRAELMDTLRIIDRGDLRPEEMLGAWAGELGQTQFLASHYVKHAVDYDGDGRRNLIASVPDVIASTANFLAHLGWKRGEPWLQEVRVPGQPALGPGRPRHPAPALEMGCMGRDLARRPAAVQPTRCRPRCCCRWGATARPSSPIRTSRSTCSGTSR